MATVPETHTVVGGLATSSEMNSYFRDPIAFLQNKPAARLRQTVAQILTTATYASITFTTEDFDDDPDGVGGHDNAVNTSRYTARYAGWYRLGGAVNFTSNATGIRACRWTVNGTAVNASESIGQSVSVGGFGSSAVARAEHVFLNVGDYVELQGRQDSGGNLNTDVNAAAMSSMSIAWERLA